jgi:hypothetical protein
MRNLIIITLISFFSLKTFASEKEVLIYKDFLQDPVSFLESDFYKSFKNAKDYKKFFNDFVNDKDSAKGLIQNNNLKDVLNVCYLTYLNDNNDIYNLSSQEGKYCLYNLGLSGISDSFGYLANYHFKNYKKILYKESRVDINELIKVSYYFGLKDSFSLNYDLGNSTVNIDYIDFDAFMVDSLVKVNNKEVLRNYYKNAKILSLDLPLNSIVTEGYENYFIDISEKYKKHFEESDINIFESFRKGNYKLIKKDLEIINENNSYIENINFNDFNSISEMCADALFSRNNFKIKSNIPEYCLSQIALNELSSYASFNLGLYFYFVSKQEDDNIKINYLLKKSILWLALSYELNHEKSFSLLKKILIENKDNTSFNEYIIHFNNSRKISKLLIDRKIKNK